MFKNYILFCFIFSFFFILGCRDDKPTHHEDPYFEDYEAPEYKWGFTNKTGKLVIPAKFDAVGKFSNALSAANYHGEWGYIDHQGKTIIPFQYKAAYPFKEEIAKVLTFSGQYQFLKKNGEVIKTVNLIRAGDFSEGMAKVELANYWGFIDRNGELIIEPDYERAWDFKNGYAKVMNYGKYGLIDETGQISVAIEYDRVKDYSEGFFLVKKDGAYFFLDNMGEKKYGPYEKAISFQNGVTYVQEQSEVKLIDGEGNEIKSQLDYNLPRYLDAGLYMAKKEGKYGLLNSEGVPLTKFEFQQFNAFHEGIAAYMKEDLWGFINTEGQLLCGPVFGLAWDFHDGLARAAFRDGIAYINAQLEPPFYPEFVDMQDFTEGLAAVQVK